MPPRGITKDGNKSIGTKINEVQTESLEGYTAIMSTIYSSAEFGLSPDMGA